MTSTAETASRPLLLTGTLVQPSGEVPDGALVVVDDTIAYAGPRSDVPPDLSAAASSGGWEDGLILLPGLVDVHCHGGAGGEFGVDGDAGRTAATHHHRCGTTTVVGSLMSATADDLVAGLRTCAALEAEGVLAGVHLEGPFLAHARCGAQDPAVLLAPDLALLARMLEAGAGAVAQMTYAPELPGASELPRALAEGGVVGAIGHTDADLATAAAALSLLASHPARGGRALVTHLFNAMPPVEGRQPGPVLAALASAVRGTAVVELIADGVHLDGGTVASVFDVVGASGIALVSDAMAAAGLADGDYSLGGRPVRVSGREARLVETGGLAGGVSSLLDQVRWCVGTLGVPLADAVAAASATPASALALDDVGRLEAGRRADVLAVDAALTRRHVLRAGRELTPLPA